MKKNRGSLFIVSAPSGSGKTTLCRLLTGQVEGITHVVSYTTRPPREGEINHRDYTFIKKDEFIRMKEDGEFIEWAEVHGNLYGTTRRRLEDILNRGIDAIHDIDTQGGAQMRRNFHDGVYIFVLPPSMDALRKRLETRMSDSPAEMEQRIKRAVEEIREYRNYDYVIVNDILEEALRGLTSIVIAERVRKDKVDPRWIEELIAEEERYGHHFFTG
jgi:guanylate kinase